jgi:hypothetical protein
MGLFFFNDDAWNFGFIIPRLWVIMAFFITGHSSVRLAMGLFFERAASGFFSLFRN